MFLFNTLHFTPNKPAHCNTNSACVGSIEHHVYSRFAFAFELNTTKHGSRVYLFAAETEQDRDKWAINIAKVRKWKFKKMRVASSRYLISLFLQLTMSLATCLTSFCDFHPNSLFSFSIVARLSFGNFQKRS